MKEHWFAIGLSVLACTANAESVQSTALPSVLTKAIEETFPASAVLTYSALCQSTANGPEQIGIILQHHDKLHAVIAVSGVNKWVLSDMPRNVAYSRGSMRDFLSDFDAVHAREYMAVRCTNPLSDPDINMHANGQFIAHKSPQSFAKHVCFSASDVYNSWVCYGTESATAQPVLSFVQFNAD